MKKHLITFGGSAYDKITERVVDTYKQFGADTFTIYDEPWAIESGFKQENQWLWDHRGLKNEGGGRGYGWFSWKPKCISHALSLAQPGDFVLYLDADTYPVADFSVLFNLCYKEGGHLAFMATGKLGPLCNRQWVKRECFQCMGLDNEEYWHGPHAVCRFMVFRNPMSTDDPTDVFQFLNEWQQHCLDHQCQTFDFDPAIQLPGPHGDGPFASFREHRTEQAIYSLLCIKYGRRLYREACEFGNECAQDWHRYPQLFTQVGSSGPKSERGSSFRDQFPVGLFR